jgi:hypothetical protein
VRIINLDHTLPKDDGSVITDKEQEEYVDVLKKLAESSKISELNISSLRSLIMQYLK